MQDLLNFLSASYGRHLENIFKNENCILFKENYDIIQHKGLSIINKFKEGSADKIIIPDAKTKPCIDEIMIIYLIYFIKVTRSDTLVDQVVKFIILLREYINLIGWDYKKLFMEYDVKVDFNYKGAYTSYNSCEEIPDFINDFISIFIEMDYVFFKIEEKYLFDLSKNFCNWLFVNNMTSFKISPNEM